jgi:hypothetical protein
MMHLRFINTERTILKMKVITFKDCNLIMAKTHGYVSETTESPSREACEICKGRMMNKGCEGSSNKKDEK